MTLNNPKGGMGYAAEFQSSALPFTTSSQAMTGVTYKIVFPKVSRFICVKNHSSAGNHIRLGFTSNGVEGGNHYKVDGGSGSGSEIALELRVKEIFIRSDGATSPGYSIIAGLTNIDASMMPLLSGTLPDGSPGWSGVG